MIDVFTRGDFDKFRLDGIRFSRVASKTASAEMIYNESSRGKTTVFLSHKHSDLKDLQGVIGLLESEYDVSIYIDSMDKAMPNQTSGETAKRIKSVIKACDRFILLATDDAVESKWCNWELGYGDALKYREKIAILPMQNVRGGQYNGHEYLSIYPSVGYNQSAGMFVFFPDTGNIVFMKQWLQG